LTTIHQLFIERKYLYILSRVGNKIETGRKTPEKFIVVLNDSATTKNTNYFNNNQIRRKERDDVVIFSALH
jgi:hypothetical protein